MKEKKTNKKKTLKKCMIMKANSGKKVYLDDIYESKENSYIDNYISDEEVENFSKLTKEYQKKKKDQIKEHANRYVEILENFNETNYEPLRHNELINHKKFK
jgi:hypothetical protein